MPKLNYCKIVITKIGIIYYYYTVYRFIFQEYLPCNMLTIHGLIVILF
jgi:hypothetical protein